ncbi:hypothetical protein A9X03_15385 [Mycobacterium sp. E1715]|nr:hypothetical protein A9X03_15385 [Mycobacterium sp. E1715]
MNAYLRVVEALRANGSRVSERGDGRAQAQCPAHDDHNPSLSIWPRDDGKGSQVKCHAQCDLPAVLAALGLTFRDLFDDAEMRDALRGNADYRYPGGRVNRRRTGPDGRKRFTQTGAQDKSLFFADKIPHGCPLVYLTEGEKGAKAIWAMGGVAVATGGAMRSCDPTPLRDTLVKVVVDRDAAGLRWAERQSKALAGIAQRVCFVRTPLNIPRADVVEHIAAGLPLEQLEDFDPSTATYDCGESPGEVPAKSRGELPDEPADRIDRVADFCGPRLIVDVPDDEIDAEKPKVWNAKDLEPAAPPRWLAANRLPRAAVSLLIGDEGIGKSLLGVLDAQLGRHGIQPAVDDHQVGSRVGVADQTHIAGEDRRTAAVPFDADHANHVQVGPGDLQPG